ncbi:MAG: hypothetical protein U9R54_05930 [Bacteroidota bacterium]|nr:hypothetical protein [Bacteroidota bacterium]
MKNYKCIVIILFLGLSNIIFAQDFDVYPKIKDDNIIMPTLYENTQFEEFQLLSRNIRMMDMAYSAIVPGYIHFKAKDNKTGYKLLAARLVGYSGFAVAYINMKNDNKKLVALFDNNYIDNSDKIILISSITIIISTYLFDWIHGKALLEKKQELIRYKYSIKLKLNEQAQLQNPNSISPTLSLTLNF